MNITSKALFINFGWKQDKNEDRKWLSRKYVFFVLWWITTHDRRADGWEVVEGFHPAPGRELPLRPSPARCRAAPSAVPHRMPGHYNHFTSIPPPTGGMWVGGVSQCTGHLTNRWVVSYCALVTSSDCCTLLITLTKFGLTTSDFQCHHYC